MDAARPLVVLPTYNEIENMPAITAGILAAAPDAAIVVVDDGSPDGTGEWVRERARSEPRLHLIARAGKLGLGTAYRAGWRWGLERGFDPIATMDADLSHDPLHLPALLECVAGGADVAVGSRYVAGGGIENWPLRRRVLSRCANLVARTLLALPARDVTSGYRAYRASALGRIEIDSIVAEGYSFLEETLWRAGRAGLRCDETPIVFANRRRGKSKIGHAEVYKAVATLVRLKILGVAPADRRRRNVTRPMPPGAAPRFDYETIPAGFYDSVCRGRGVQSKWHHVEFEAVRAEIGSLAPLLDVGCGPGTFLGTIGDGRECVGLDVAAAQIEYAARTYGAPHRVFRTAPGAALPVEDASFACVTMIEVIEHIHDTDAALADAVRALRPGGRLVVTTPNYASHWPLLEWLVGRLSPVDYAHQHVSRFKPRLLSESLARAGLRDVRVRTFMRLAPFAAALSWRLADVVARVERSVPLAPGALLLGVGDKPA